MSKLVNDLRIFVTTEKSFGSRPNELARTMATHPLMYQELPYKPEYTVYNRRLASTGMTNYSADEAYWMVRSNVIMRHTGELPLEIIGPDAEKFLNKIFTRDIRKNKIGRCSYQFACYHDGGMITDGILVRLSQDRFLYGQADGDLFSWLKAHSQDFNVKIFDPCIWISQVQGPNSLKVLKEAIDDNYPEPFRYFDMAEVKIANQQVIITRTGFTNELGWEYYLLPNTNIEAIGNKILEAGKKFEMMPTSAEAFRTRRIEAGLLNAGSDFDSTVDPYAAGCGHLVDLSKFEFIGKKSLQKMKQQSRTWGLKVSGGVPKIGRYLIKKNATVGTVCSSSYSPFLQCGVAIIRIDNYELSPGTKLEVMCTDEKIKEGKLCTLPMYDEKGDIVRGKKINIPKKPTK